jgi:short-subunit dehydrogenase
VYKAALITGVNPRGIGWAFAEALPLSTDLLLTGRRPREFAAFPKRRLDYFEADLRHYEQREGIVRRATEFGVDLFVCNAAAAHFGDFLDKPLDAELDMLGVNITAVVHLLHRLVPVVIANAERRDSRGGVIVMSSTAALHPSGKMASYAAAKVFQMRLVESLAIELAQRPIDLVVVCPSYTDTGMFEKAGISTRHLTRPMFKPRYVADRAIAALGKQTVLILKEDDTQATAP